MRHKCLGLDSELRQKHQHIRGTKYGLAFILTVLATSRYESRLWVGFIEYVPQKAAGMRTEPPI